MAGLSTTVNSGIDYENQNFALGNPLDMADCYFTPIGNTSDNYFKGNFDGCGNSILNMFLKSGTGAGSYGGLFGYINSNNNSVKIANIDITQTNLQNGTNNYQYFGGLVGYITGNNAVIENVRIEEFSGKTVKLDTYDSYVGGVAGYANIKEITDGTVRYFEMTGEINYGGEFAGYLGNTNIVNSQKEGVVIEGKGNVLIGAGTEADPYIISSLEDMELFSNYYNDQNAYGKHYYWRINSDIDMSGDTSAFSTISRFEGNLDGGGYTLDNMSQRLFNMISPYGNTAMTIKNLNISYLPNTVFEGGNLFGWVYEYNGTGAVTIDNVHIIAPSCMARCTNVLTQAVKNYSAFCTVSKDNFTTINNCSIRGLTMEAYGTSADTTREQYMSGFVGADVVYSTSIPRLTITNCYADTDIKVTENLSNSVYVAGFTAFCYSGYLTMDSCVYDGDIYTTSAKVKGVKLFSTNTRSLYSKSISNILVQGNAYVENNSSYNTVYFGVDGSNIILNSTIDTKSPTTVTTYSPFSRADASYDWTNCVFNRDKITNRNTNATMDSFGATTDEDMKLRSTYADWADFDEHWIIDPNINNGYPMLRAFVDVAKVTGFDGSGTETDPYLIKTQQDLSGMASYYNDNVVFGQNNIYWQLANDIDVSRDANNMLIHFTPICYNKEFDGYFDGAGHTITGLLIDNQYEYTGLFGTIGANAYVKNLTVKGNIYWDEAYAVGGVAGRVLASGYLQNCRFEGNIVGILNTKTSTECSGVVGKYEINGAIDCSAQYTDLKYAKMTGTADEPSYTYYLYDWAQMTTNLYDYKVS